MAMLVFYTINQPNNWLTSADWALGPHTLKLHVMPNAYVGMDIEAEVKFTLVDAEKVDRDKPHEEDNHLEGADALTLYSMLNPQAQDNQDSDFEGDDGDGDVDNS